MKSAKKIKGAVKKKLNFDIQHMFILRAEEYYADILEIHRDFPFDLMICDNAFTAIPFVKDLMQKPVVVVGVLPLTETSKDLQPAGLRHDAFAQQHWQNETGGITIFDQTGVVQKNRTGYYTSIMEKHKHGSTTIILCLI